MKNDNNILKWLDNDLSEAETKDLKQSEGFAIIEKIAYYSSQMEAPKVNAEKALVAFRAKNLGETKVRKLNFSPYIKYAAILVVALTIGYFSFFNPATTFATKIAQTETIALPDNSQVTLNAVSTLSYSKTKWDKERHLDLEGEAFFKVSKGKKFTVKTNAGDIQVLGTQFNVKERDNYFEVQCYEGQVAVTYNNQTIKLTKGKSFRVIDNKIENTDDFNALNPSWINNESSYTKVPLKHVIEDFENYYNLKIITQDIDTNKLFNGAFTHNNKNTALQSITIPLKLSYKIEGDTITLYKYEE
jgi:ferric-dicitrate binding protein FerR (iron transport regulator)